MLTVIHDARRRCFWILPMLPPFTQQGKHEEAGAMFSRAIDIEERSLGCYHPHLVNLLRNHAGSMLKQVSVGTSCNAQETGSTPPHNLIQRKSGHHGKEGCNGVVMQSPFVVLITDILNTSRRASYRCSCRSKHLSSNPIDFQASS